MANLWQAGWWDISIHISLMVFTDIAFIQNYIYILLLVVKIKKYINELAYEWLWVPPVGALLWLLQW